MWSIPSALQPHLLRPFSLLFSTQCGGVLQALCKSKGIHPAGHWSVHSDHEELRWSWWKRLGCLWLSRGSREPAGAAVWTQQEAAAVHGGKNLNLNATSLCEGWRKQIWCLSYVTMCFLHRFNLFPATGSSSSFLWLFKDFSLCLRVCTAGTEKWQVLRMF